MYQFFVEPHQINGNTAVISGNDVNHIKNVLRMQVDDEISLSNGIDGKEYRVGIKEMLADEIVCELRFVKEDQIELPNKIYLFQALPKSDKMELIVQKAVELGAYEIIPVATKRCVVKLDDKKAKNKIARWQAIAEAAAKQSKRSIVPKIAEVLSFKEAISKAESLDVKLIPYELAKGIGETKQILQDIKKGQSVAIFIGPEGGFAEEEMELAMQKSILPITLGKRILRTETAGMAILSVLMFQFENEE